jgi:hypothetical protein
LHASCTVALGGSVTGFWLRLISAISRVMMSPPACRQSEG